MDGWTNNIPHLTAEQVDAYYGNHGEWVNSQGRPWKHDPNDDWKQSSNPKFFVPNAIPQAVIDASGDSELRYAYNKYAGRAPKYREPTMAYIAWGGIVRELERAMTARKI